MNPNYPNQIKQLALHNLRATFLREQG